MAVLYQLKDKTLPNLTPIIPQQVITKENVDRTVQIGDTDYRIYGGKFLSIAEAELIHNQLTADHGKR